MAASETLDNSADSDYMDYDYDYEVHNDWCKESFRSITQALAKRIIKHFSEVTV